MNRKTFFTTLFAAPLAFCAAVKAPQRRLGYRLICKLDPVQFFSRDGKRDLTYGEYILWVQRCQQKEAHRIPL